MAFAAVPPNEITETSMMDSPSAFQLMPSICVGMISSLSQLFFPTIIMSALAFDDLLRLAKGMPADSLINLLREHPTAVWNSQSWHIYIQSYTATTTPRERRRLLASLVAFESAGWDVRPSIGLDKLVRLQLLNDDSPVYDLLYDLLVHLLQTIVLRSELKLYMQWAQRLGASNLWEELKQRQRQLRQDKANARREPRSISSPPTSVVGQVNITIHEQNKEEDNAGIDAGLQDNADIVTMPRHKRRRSDADVNSRSLKRSKK